MNRTALVWMGACVCMLAVPMAQSQTTYPTRPMRLVVGFTAGSEIDVVARMLAHEMPDKWGQRVIVDNRAGAGGTVAGAIVVGATPDGHTLYFNSVSHTASSTLYPKLSYDPVRDFSPVSQATSAPNVLVVAPSQNIRTVKELIALVQQKPGQIHFGSAGVGSGTHITGELFKTAANLNVVHTPYKGVPELLTDTVTARIPYSFSPIGNTLGFVKEKRLVALGVTTLVRSPSLPDVPTVAEAAIPGFEWDQWYGMFAPANTPRAIVSQVATEMARVLALPEISSRLAVRGSVAKASTPEQFDKFVRAEVAKVSKALKAAGVKLE